MAVKGVKAWLLYWEFQPGKPLPIARDGEVVGILPAAWGRDRVLDVLERLYLERVMTPSELLRWRVAYRRPIRPSAVLMFIGYK
jgi:hypothetical protein